MTKSERLPRSMTSARNARVKWPGAPAFHANILIIRDRDIGRPGCKWSVVLDGVCSPPSRWPLRAGPFVVTISSRRMIYSCRGDFSFAEYTDRDWLIALNLVSEPTRCAVQKRAP